MSASADPDSAPRRLPVWVLVGIGLAALVVAVLVVVVATRLLSQRPTVLLGPTPAEALVPGACLAEPDADLAQYTTVWCDGAHAQQVFAVADLTLDPAVLGSDDQTLTRYGDELCARYLEYSVYLSDAVDADSRDDYRVQVLAVPARADYDAGAHSAVCSISAADGSDLTQDLYRPMG
ncbi:MAG: septum formation family protein [Actinomycetales bacterium]|nr:septum formation family protein [Actinomycetales bacterium]